MPALRLMQAPDCVVDVLGVLVDAHLGQGCQLLLLRHALESVCQRDQVLEGTSEELCRLLVLATQSLQILFNLGRECRCIETFSSGEVGLDRSCE